MKALVLMFGFISLIAAISATCFYCEHHNRDHQELNYEELRPLEYTNQAYYNDKSLNITEKFRIIQNIIQKYPLYYEKAQKDLKFSDPLNLVDTTEFFDNGEIEYKNAIIRGLGNSILKDIIFDDFNKNMFLISATLKKAEIMGSYAVANSNFKDIETGHFYIILKDITFEAKLSLEQILQIQPKFYTKSITFNYHESIYSNDETLKELKTGNTQVPKPYIYYYNYVNEVVKERLANEMTISFMPLIAKRLEQLLKPAILFPTNDMIVPNANAIITPGVRARISNTLINDLSNTNKIQKLTNYTIYQDLTKMIFSFTSFDLRGSTKWALEYNTGNEYHGMATFAVDNIQTIIVVSKSHAQKKMIINFVKTIVNGLTMILHNDENCESIRVLVQQRMPHVLEQSLKMFISDQSEIVLKKQINLIGENY